MSLNFKTAVPGSDIPTKISGDPVLNLNKWLQEDLDEPYKARFLSPV